MSDAAKQQRQPSSERVFSVKLKTLDVIIIMLLLPFLLLDVFVDDRTNYEPTDRPTQNNNKVVVVALYQKQGGQTDGHWSSQTKDR